MTQEDVIRIAKEAGMTQDGEMWFSNGKGDMDVEHKHLEAFAKLVQEHEREACAKECEHTALRISSEWMAHHCAAAIRARGEQA
jgi:hypothetical protein